MFLIAKVRLAFPMQKVTSLLSLIKINMLFFFAQQTPFFEIGLPITPKTSFSVYGLPRTCGSIGTSCLQVSAHFVLDQLHWMRLSDRPIALDAYKFSCCKVSQCTNEFIIKKNYHFTLCTEIIILYIFYNYIFIIVLVWIILYIAF